MRGLFGLAAFPERHLPGLSTLWQLPALLSLLWLRNNPCLSRFICPLI